MMIKQDLLSYAKITKSHIKTKLFTPTHAISRILRYTVVFLFNFSPNLTLSSGERSTHSPVTLTSSTPECSI